MEENVIVADRNGVIIQKGDKVIWHDPEFDSNTPEYEVYEEPDEEMIKLYSPYGECEALPEECEVIWTKDKVERWVDECAGGCAYELLDEGGFPFSKSALDLIQEMQGKDDEINDDEFANFIYQIALNNAK